MTINRWTPEPNIVLHQALGKVAEEAAELAKIATRCTIQGFHEADPVTGKPNREQFREEVADLKAAMRWLFEIIDEPYKGESPRERRKFDGFREWQAMLEAEAAERPFREDDIRRGLILFRTSNSAHGLTNCISVPAKLDELPQEARDEIAIAMHNMADSLAPALERMNEGQRTTMTIKVDASAAIAAMDAKLAEISSASEEEAEDPDWQAFETADFYWRTMDPDDSGDHPAEALNKGMVGLYSVCEVACSYTGPTRFGFIAPVLDPESDDDEFLHFATQAEAIGAAQERKAAVSQKAEP